ncbi:MAG: acylphosphatase [Aestuariivirga sp.]|uniref:acylphosphatase n=1 Tax=Aestuariivirga sp. TaxID=2650926 RepID=UPI0025C42CDD|nr:acylphosphatase [Aestuariivirga sp.]MCA3561317.1 acylphosphatase [Aestuariivirga sp.]
MSLTTLHVFVEGRVQGVGFRAFVEREADERALRGWVRNRSDGRVEAVFMGGEEDVQSMIAACHRGPRLSLVRNVTSQPHPPGDWRGFEVWPTV